MQTLTMKDLATTRELDRDAMRDVRGGNKLGMSYPPIWCPMPGFQGPGSADASIHATQDLSQLQQVENATANGSAYLSGVDVHNTTKQFGQNNISVG